ncbi:organic cation/carnitine transporter 7-like isoform X2 [Daucus carota subsp. sativus]|uniref:organic cation/carnitine transporter 7-like isoform X2 n=1 Tax=Daucus carota subsp. sativus TaxID=79200 RepID=UPI0007EFABDE|nr:PREDICTED: organic cation/carnitine transporter 7-like isoform X2 [Daucus carota subsp. sativus]
MTNHQMVNNHDGPMYTLDEALVAVGFGKFQSFVLIYAGLGSISEAMEVMILSFIGDSVKSKWNLSSTQESLITTVVFAGMLLGAYSWGVISDKYGRRTGLLSVALVTSGAGLLSAFSPNYIILVILRFLVGVGLGGGPVYTSWFLEFVPVPNRGVWMVVFSTFWTVGTIIEASLGWLIMPRLGWRWLLALSSVPAFAALLFYGLTPESPKYLCINGQTTEALNIMRKVAAVNQKELPAGILIPESRNELDGEFDQRADSDSLAPSAKDIVFSNSGFSTVLILLSSKLRRTTLLLWVVFFGNAFSYYGIILLTSKLSSEKNHCNSSTMSLYKSKNQDDTLYIDVFVTSLAELPGIILSALIVDRIGRKLSMVSMFVLGCGFLMPLVVNQSGILTTGLLFGARMFIIGTFTISYIYAPEIYPTSVRATGVGIASSVGRVGGMISPLVAVKLVTDCHQAAAVLLFAGVILLSGLSVLLLPLETKGRKLSDTVTASAPTSSA